jgi:hypothetical protein
MLPPALTLMLAGRLIGGGVAFEGAGSREGEGGEDSGTMGGEDAAGG